MTIDPHSDDVLAEATQLLRQHTDAGWTAISGDILQRAFAAFRPSEPVRGRHEHGDFFVASTVIVARLRRVIDDIPHAAATKITCATDDQQHLAEVTIQIIAAYGTHLLALADQVHQAGTETLRGVLGDHAPAAGAIHTHVHIGDITDDPRDVV